MVVVAFYQTIGGCMFKHVKMRNGEQYDMQNIQRNQDRPKAIHCIP